ncbi:MAG: 3-keto-disaccharide hydrolase [Thermogutta sp.]
MMRTLGMSAVLMGMLSLAAGRAVFATEACLTQEEQEQGFVCLFDGTSLEHWQGDTKGYVIEDGVLVCKPGGNLYTKNEYGDFIFRFEFKLTPNANNGVGIRTPMGCDAAYCGMEIQILDDSGDSYRDKLQPYQYHGSIYGVVPAKRGHLKPVGEWNAEEILCQGRHVRVTLNGVVIVDAQLDKVEPIDHRDHPGLARESGYIGFLGHGTRVEFRNIRIKDLSENK